MGSTSIQWTDATWNPTRGCELVSAGCKNCYAMKQAHRFSGSGKAYEGLTELGPNGPRWTGKLRLVPESLDQPLHWKKPRRVFVNSMSDLFHEDVPFTFLDRVFNVMLRAPQHTFQILTKRPERMKHYVGLSYRGFDPLPNVWLGVSVEDQKNADERIPLLLQTPAAVRFVSYEPALGPVDFRHVFTSSTLLDWLIVGGESGPGARPFAIRWARDAVRHCKSAGVPVFVKQMGGFALERNDRIADAWYYADGSDMDTEAIDGDSYRYQGAPVRLLLNARKGGNPEEWPEDLRVREFPGA